MARRRIQKRKNISKRIKTGNKKSLVSRRKKQIPHSTLWDKTLSFPENFRNIGIMTNINKEIDKATNKKEKKEENIKVTEEISLENLEKGKIVLTPIEYTPKKVKMTPDEKMIIEKLVKKYKDDFKKMFKDIKLNKFQWNVGQIKKFHEKYIKIYGNFK